MENTLDQPVEKNTTQDDFNEDDESIMLYEDEQDEAENEKLYSFEKTELEGKEETLKEDYERTGNMNILIFQKFFNKPDSYIPKKGEIADFVSNYSYPEYFLHAIEYETNVANSKFPPFASLHEGYAVMKEEVEEFWELVKCFKYTNSEIDHESLEEVEGELIQIAAMAVKNLQLVETMKAKIQGKIL